MMRNITYKQAKDIAKTNGNILDELTNITLVLKNVSLNDFEMYLNDAEDNVIVTRMFVDCTGIPSLEYVYPNEYPQTSYSVYLKELNTNELLKIFNRFFLETYS